MKSLLVIATLIGSVSYAADLTEMPWRAQLDIRQQAIDIDCGAGCEKQEKLCFAVGATAKFELANNFALRTGGMFSQRILETKNAGTTNTINYTYVDVPVLPEYAFNEMFSAYAGVVVALKAARACDVSGGCSAVGDKTLITPFQVGGAYNIDEQWTARLTYETGTTLATSTATDYKTANVIVLGGGYTF